MQWTCHLQRSGRRAVPAPVAQTTDRAGNSAGADSRAQLLYEAPADTDYR